MSEKHTAVFGTYPTYVAFESGLKALKIAGFRNTDISVLLSENEGSKDFAHEENTKAPEGVTAGARTGAVAGGLLGWLVGIGSLTIPGVGLFLAVGPIVGALGGTIGGIAGALVGMGIPEYEAKRYEGRVKDGGILISVHCDDSVWTKCAKAVLERTGAQDIALTGEAKADCATPDKPLSRASPGGVGNS